MEDLDKLKIRLDKVREELHKTENVFKENTAKAIYEGIAVDEKNRQEKELQRKQLKEQEQQLQESFSDKLEVDIVNSRKILGFIKRYVLIGAATGVTGIAIAYLFDKLQENKILKDLYKKNIESVTNPNNKELSKEYELLKKKFNKVYDIEKVEQLLKKSEDIEKLKSNTKELEKLNNEIKRCRASYEKKLNYYIENQIMAEEKELAKVNITQETEDGEELEISIK